MNSNSNLMFSYPLMINIGGEKGHGKDTVFGILANLFYQKFHVECNNCKFAKELRRSMSALTDIPPEQTETKEQKEQIIKERYIPVQEMMDRCRQAYKIATKHLELTDSPNIRVLANILQVLTRISANKIEQMYTESPTTSSISFFEMTVGRFLQLLGTEAFRDYVGEQIWIDAMFYRLNLKKVNINTDTRFSNEQSACQKHGSVSIYVHNPNVNTTTNQDGRSSDHASENKSNDFIKSFDFYISNDGDLEKLKSKVVDLWPRLVDLYNERNNKTNYCQS